MFEVIDADGDGVITKNELRQAIKSLKTLDADGDGNISLEEASPLRGPGGRGGDPNQMIDRMMENDLNGDGLLTVDEVPEPMARMLTGADLNGDQAIDRNELGQAMQNMRGGPGGPGGGNFGGGRGGNFGGAGGDPDSMTRQIMSADQNGDGVISSKELDPQLAARMQGADTNGDGALNAKEVRLYMETARQRMQQFRGPGGRFDPRQRAREQPPQ
jgi:Ca2+-binding EF-hand superfamily protein